MAYTIFLSHSSSDKEWVKWIAANAQQVGIEVYLYEHDPQPGRLVADKLQAAIHVCDSLVVLITGNSQFSPYVQQEIGSAKALNKPVIPLVQPGIGQSSLAMLQGEEYIPFDFASPEHAMSALLDYLQRAKQSKEKGQGALLVIGAIIVGALLLKGKG
ncbi:MAG: toll/interleukin-1 receptor domain-containing protein [Acidobacteriia bacterium]|nr:toll/interleukin-1 receptor domain-containing protein [Terriglobia bacterium]